MQPKGNFHVLRWWLIFSSLLAPFCYLVGLIATQKTGPDPGEFITRFTGEWALNMLVVCLCITPLNQLMGWRWTVKYRRMVGLYAWFYATVHLAAASLLVLDVEILLEDIVKRPYVTVGFIAFIILTLLAITSPKPMVRRLGKRWKTLHKGIYLASLLVLIHYFWLTRADYTDPIIYSTLVALLLAYRLFRALKQNIQRQHNPLRSS